MSVADSTHNISLRRLTGQLALVILPVSAPPLICLVWLAYEYSRTWNQQPSIAFFRLALALLGLAILFAVLTAWLTSRQLTLPLAKVSAAMHALMSGELDQRLPLPDKPVLDDIFRLYNQLADEYRSTYHSATLHTTDEREGSSGFSTSESAVLLYQAGCRISLSETEEEALSSACRALEQASTPAVILIAATAEPSSPMQMFSSSGRLQNPSGKSKTFSYEPKRLISYFKRGKPLIITDPASAQLPQPLLELQQQISSNPAAFLPVLRAGNLRALLLLGLPSNQQPDVDPFFENNLAPYYNLIEMLAVSIERIRLQAHTSRQLEELRSFWNVSQVISLETEPGPLFRTIHHQAERVMGELSSFAIALYDAPSGAIRIPYMIEDGQVLDIAPFPLGEGLTSILVRTRKPLLLDEDVETKSRALGAKVQGQPAKSWLGVPMLYSGEVVGAIIVQDIQQEKRFNEEDIRLLSTLASQAAVVVRNARLLEGTRRQAHQERQLNEITAHIRRSADVQTILKTTASELGTALGVRRAHIRIGLETDEMQPAERSG